MVEPFLIRDSDDEPDDAEPVRPRALAAKPKPPARLSLPTVESFVNGKDRRISAPNAQRSGALKETRQEMGVLKQQVFELPRGHVLGEQPPPARTGPGGLRQQKLEAEQALDVVQEELEDVLARKQKLQALLVSIERQLREAEENAEEKEQDRFRKLNQKVDWKSEDFAWSEMLRELAHRFFSIRKFRPPQLEAMNATLSSRDVFMVAATGHGKSLTFQLPALLHPSITLVISPLVSLSRDQVLGLQERGIRAAMLWSKTSKDEERRIYDEMLWGPDGAPKSAKSASLQRGARANAPPDIVAYLSSLGEDEEPFDGSLRVVYCTPERLVKNKRFMSLLEKCYGRGRLARLVVDEAHSVSTLSHDFRPDYKKLGMLRQLFPNLPILALSATCPPSLVASCFSILRLKDIEHDPRSGCFILSSDLYRPNLHYSVLQKSSSGDQQVSEIADWISEHHPHATGIVYTLSRKDAEVLALGLQEAGVLAGVYHADCDPADRDRVHSQWRSKKLRVVCATIAFGLGIDLPDVRFVLHATLSKSVEAYYQESGRAGRDGKDADCVLFYRPSDFCRILALTVGDQEGKRGLVGMLRYCQSLDTCRRVLQERYFGGDGAAAKVVPPCGHCDNCLRDKTLLKNFDATEDAIAVCKILEAVRSSATSKAKGEKLTLLKLLDLWRGNGLKQQSQVVVAAVPTDARKRLSLTEMERIVVECFISGLIEEDIHVTAYTTVAYLRSSARGSRLVRMHVNNPNDVRQRIEVVFDSAAVAAVKPKKRKSVAGAADQAGQTPGKASVTRGKEDDTVVLDDSDDEAVHDERFEAGFYEQEDFYEQEEDEKLLPARKRRAAIPDSDDDDIDD